MIGEINAHTPEYNDPNEPKQIKVTLNFGIFFDGTNNNKVQSMIALNSRRNKFFKKYKKELKQKFPKVKDYKTLSREELKTSGIGTVNELDNIFGSSENINLDIEKQIAEDNLTDYRYSSAADKYDGPERKGFIGSICKYFIDDARREKLSRAAGNASNKFVIFKDLWSISSSKGSGYTNVALLESLYDTTGSEENNKQDTDSGDLELYYSIYIEGSGANEEISVIKQLIAYKDSIIGLGFGVNDYGVTKKCRKAVDQVMRTYDKYVYRNDISKIDCHFDVFGFGRGATTARLFTYLLNPKKKIKYVDHTILKRVCGNGQFLLKNNEIDFKLGPIGEYLYSQVYGTKDNRGSAVSSENIFSKTIIENSFLPYDSDEPTTHQFSTLDEDESTSNGLDFNTEVLTLENLDLLESNTQGNSLTEKLKSYESKLGTKNVRVLGIFDTVASIGVYRDSSSYILGDKILGDKFLKIGKSGDLVTSSSIFHDTNVDDFGLYATDQADDVLHICALDEYRKNFALVDIDSSIDLNGTEIYIPGCHTDIGGGASIGLDAFKIINYDDIASKGELIYNLYNRITGLNKLIKSISKIVKNVGLVAGTTMTAVSIVKAYSSIKSILYDICDTTDNFFSFMTGFESVAEYRVYADEAVQKHDEPLSGDFSYIQRFADNCSNIVSTTKGLPEKSTNVSRSINNLLDTVTDNTSTIKEDISAIADLTQSVTKLLSSIKTIKKSLIELFSNIKNCKTLLSQEFDDWRNLIDRLTVTDDKIRLIFDPQRKRIKLQIEQRRICMYMGNPYNPDFQSSTVEQKKIKPICKETLQELGWISTAQEDTLIPDERTWTTGRPTKESIETAEKKGISILIERTKVAHFFQRDNIGICKYSKPGYPYVALNAMYEWATEKGCRFREENGESAIKKLYPVPDDLKDFYTHHVKPNYDTKQRSFCIPNPTDSKDYKYLRRTYLHLSMNQQLLGLADNGLVNGPSFISVASNLTDKQRQMIIESKSAANKDTSYKKDNVISRRIYRGIKGTYTQSSNTKSFFGGPKVQSWYLGDISVTSKF